MTLDRLAAAMEERLGAPPRALLEAQEQRWLDESARLMAGSPWRRARWAWVAAPLSLAAAAAFALWIVRASGSAALPAGPAVAVSAVELDVAALGSEQRLELPSGGLLVLTPGSSGQVRSAGQTATDVVIDRGELSLDLPRDTGRHWSVTAGPYRVSVVGTAFRVAWRPKDAVLTVDVQRGSVRVSGGEVGNPGRLLGPGERLVAGVSSATPALSAEASAPDAVGLGGSASAAAASNWRALAQKRSYREALAAAEREGFEPLCQRLRPTELASLADVARLAGSPARSNQALGALRQRFPGSPEASSAAFLLGRQGGSRAHAEWLETYLREAPRGSYAQEAQGRLIVLYRGLGDLERARAGARRYLSAYPTGAYVEHARAALAIPGAASSR